ARRRRHLAVQAEAAAARAAVVATAVSKSRGDAGLPEILWRADRALLLRLDKLDGLETWAFDQHGPRVAELVRLFQEVHVLALELRDPGFEVRPAPRDVIHELSACGAQRPLLPIHIP